MNPKILVVDDEPDVCEGISSYFCKRGYSVFTATSAEEAISRLVREKPHLVILDIRMPKIDGIECLRQIKKLDKEVLVIMVTCATELEIARQALELGAVDYFTKPLGLNALETAISTYLLLHTDVYYSHSN